MEEELRESEQGPKSLFESAIDGILAIDVKTRAVTYVNPAICKMLGYSEKELIGMSVYDIYPQEAYELGCHNFEEPIQGVKSLGREVPCIKKDGKFIYADLYVTELIRNRKRYVVVFYRDTTKQKETQEALVRSERLYRMLAENVRDVICATDMALHFTYVSPSVTDLLGYSVEEFMALTLEEILTPTSYNINMEIFVDELDRVRLGKRDLLRSRTLELENIHKDGSIIWTELKITFLRDKNRRLVGTVGVIRDITERKRIYNALMEREKELENKAKDLEEVNTALRVLLKKRGEDKTELEEKVLFNMKKLALPYLAKLKESSLGPKQKTYADILESNLNEIISPFARGLSTKYLTLTSAEIQVANLIKQGKSTKDIAEMLNLSYKTIQSHRSNIRSKMGIKKRKINLKTHLLSRHNK